MKVVASYKLGTRLDYQDIPQIQNLEVCNKGVMKMYSWLETFAMFWMLYAFFWAIPWRLNFICQRFRTLSVLSS